MWHGSDVELRPGTILVPGRGMMADRSRNPVEALLEATRPVDKPARSACVFMVEDPQDVDNCGGNTDWLFHVRPIGDHARHDVSLISAIQCAVEEDDIAKASDLAKAYWQGKPGDQPVWEILAGSAEILTSEHY